MKLIPKRFWSGQLAGVFLGALAMSRLASAADGQVHVPNVPPKATNPDMRVEVLSLTVSKLGRDVFGNAIDPFLDSELWKERAGTVVLAKITPPPERVKLLPEKCRLVSFKDDIGTDLFTNATAGLGDGFFAGNRAFEVLSASEPGSFGVRIRSAQLPARGATRLAADVLLAFAPTSGEKFDVQSDLLIKTGAVTTVEPVKIKFTAVPPGYSHQTNQPAAQTHPVYWLASFLPEAGVMIVSVAVFSEKSDEPILLVKDLNADGKAGSSNNSSYGADTGKEEAKDVFSGRIGYSFTPPEDGKVSIKVRYFPTSALIEKHCVISTGISP